MYYDRRVQRNYTIGSLFDSDSAAEIGDAQYIDAADMNQDGRVNSLDLVLMRKALTDYSTVSAVYEWEEPPVTTVTTVPAATTTTTTTTTSNLDFISPPIYDLYGSMPSQGEANVAIFYVDFPDCTFDYDPINRGDRGRSIRRGGHFRQQLPV